MVRIYVKKGLYYMLATFAAAAAVFLLARKVPQTFSVTFIVLVVDREGSCLYYYYKNFGTT